MGLEGLYNFNRTFESEVGRAFQSHIPEAVSGSSEAYLKPISASRQKVHRGHCIVQRSVNQAGCGYSRAACERFGFNTTFVRADGYFSRFNFLDEIYICPVWAKRRMMTDLSAPGLDRRRLELVDARYDMWYPGVNEMGRELNATDIESPAQDKAMRLAHRQSDEFAIQLGLNDSGLSFKTDVGEYSGNLVDKAREASRTVPAHLRFATVPVVIAHPKIGFTRWGFDKKHPIGTDASMAVT
jgi:hypothetical protein